MHKEDGRHLSPVEKHQMRKMVVRGHNRGRTPRQISEDTGLTDSGVRQILKKYLAGGMKAIAPCKVGRKSGTKRVLSPEQEQLIQKMIQDDRPEQLKLEFALWTREAVRQLIKRECKVELGVRSVGKYLKRWGFTPQKPIRRAYEQQPEAVAQWLTEEYPKIARQSKEEKGEIHWGDETAVVNTDVRGRGYSPKGKTPVTCFVGGKRAKLSMISTVTNQGKTRWMIIDGAFNAQLLIEFLEALIKDAERKIFLILDNCPFHHCYLVKDWLAARRDQIEVFFLPSYSPQLNPDERLNASLKHKISTSVPVRTKDKLRAATEAHMNYLHQSPHIVKAFFQDPLVKYAAQTS